MIDTLLARIGIGNAQVDTVLHSNRLTIGDELRGQVVLQGGQVAQRIGQIYLDLMYLQEFDDKYTWASWKQWVLNEELELAAKAKEVIDFAFRLEHHLPISRNPNTPHPWKISRHQTKLRTGLSVAWAVDPQDSDPIEIHPSLAQEKIIAALEALGFGHRATSHKQFSRYIGSQKHSTLEFAPVSGEFRGVLDEVEISFLPRMLGLECLVQVDTRKKGLGGLLADAMDTDERHFTLSWNQDIPSHPDLVHFLREKIIQHRS